MRRVPSSWDSSLKLSHACPCVGRRKRLIGKINAIGNYEGELYEANEKMLAYAQRCGFRYATVAYYETAAAASRFFKDSVLKDLRHCRYRRGAPCRRSGRGRSPRR